jgi:methylenetetrahydrofolate dehydrogenase (NADP+)/methenyltetrahydrofolate cyclohydrolase/formyltetrahydrofolate synthetase
MREAWITLWKENVDGHIRSVKLNELAYVTIDPHALTSETFAFFKKQKEDEEPAFILRFGQEPVQARLSPINKPSAQDTSLQHMPRKPDVPAHFTWATSKKTGRPHANDGWEYEMRSGEKVRVMKDAGRNWYIVSGRTGVTGYCHSSWLDFGDGHHHEDPKTAYVRFLKDIQEVLVSGNLREFPAMPSYIDTCTKPECQQVKEDEASVGICVHDLMVLLGGSGCYSHEWLKESRNMWHPDRFSRYCVPAVADQLKAKAQQMFVLYGLLMEMV